MRHPPAPANYSFPTYENGESRGKSALFAPRAAFGPGDARRPHDPTGPAAMTEPQGGFGTAA